jgi:ankyrin repeat protein
VEGWTALMFAAQNYHPQTVGVLLEHKAAVDLQDANGNTALWKAVFQSRNYDIKQFLE